MPLGRDSSSPSTSLKLSWGSRSLCWSFLDMVQMFWLLGAILFELLDYPA